MIALVALTAALVAGAYVALVSGTTCGYRWEAVMGTCLVLGRHSVHVYTYDDALWWSQTYGTRPPRSYRADWPAPWSTVTTRHGAAR